MTGGQLWRRLSVLLLFATILLQVSQALPGDGLLFKGTPEYNEPNAGPNEHEVVEYPSEQNGANDGQGLSGHAEPENDGSSMEGVNIELYESFEGLSGHIETSVVEASDMDRELVPNEQDTDATLKDGSEKGDEDIIERGEDANDKEQPQEGIAGYQMEQRADEESTAVVQQQGGMERHSGAVDEKELQDKASEAPMDEGSEEYPAAVQRGGEERQSIEVNEKAKEEDSPQQVLSMLGANPDSDLESESNNVNDYPSVVDDIEPKTESISVRQYFQDEAGNQETEATSNSEEHEFSTAVLQDGATETTDTSSHDESYPTEKRSAHVQADVRRASEETSSQNTDKSRPEVAAREEKAKKGFSRDRRSDSAESAVQSAEEKAFESPSPENRSPTRRLETSPEVTLVNNPNPNLRPAFHHEYCNKGELTDLLKEAYDRVAKKHQRTGGVILSKDLIDLFHGALNPDDQPIAEEEEKEIRVAVGNIRVEQGLQDENTPVPFGFVSRGSPLKALQRLAKDVHVVRKRRLQEQDMQLLEADLEDNL